MPPRSTGMRLDGYQRDQLQKSLESLAALDDALNSADASDGHTVVHPCTTRSSTTRAGRALRNQLKSVAVFGTVDALDVDGMALTHDGAEAGKFVVINAHSCVTTHDARSGLAAVIGTPSNTPLHESALQSGTNRMGSPSHASLRVGMCAERG